MSFSCVVSNGVAGVRKELSSAIEEVRDRQVFFITSCPPTKAGAVHPGMALAVRHLEQRVSVIARAPAMVAPARAEAINPVLKRHNVTMAVLQWFRAFFIRHIGFGCDVWKHGRSARGRRVVTL
jgi:hypothetical protein